MSDGYSGRSEAETDDREQETDPMMVHPDSVDREFDYRGWILVAAVFVSFVVIPGILFVYPHVGAMFGLSFWGAYLVLPLVPAVTLGILAVWATTRP
ncbi:MAG: hypothetical protein PPP58_09505 [Natronomonas sp.]